MRLPSSESPELDRSVGFVAARAGPREFRALARLEPTHIVVEDAALLESWELSGSGHCCLMSDLVPSVQDRYSPELTAQTAVVLDQLRLALGANQWRHADVSLWDAVMHDFYWRSLESLLQGTDAATRILDELKPAQVIVTGSHSFVARALIAAAQVRGIRVRVLQKPASRLRSAVRAMAAPYAAHARDSVRAAFTSRKMAPAGRSPFILLNHALRNFRAVESVVRELQRRVTPERVVVIQTGTDGQQEIEASGVAVDCFERYVSLKEGLRGLLALVAPMALLTSGRWKKRVADAGIVCGGIPLGMLADREISFDLSRLLSNTVREIACARNMLAEERPAVVLMTEDRSSFTRSVGFSARARGVPCLLIPFGMIRIGPMWLARMAADLVAVEGEAAAEVIRSCEGASKVRVIVTGQPKYDHLREQARCASRVDICRQLFLDPARPIVLYTPHPVREASAQMRKHSIEESRSEEEIVAVVRALEVVPGAQLIVKPHPNEASSLHARLVEKHGNPDVRLVPQADSVYPLLFASDVLVTQRSSAGLEGVLLNKPLVIVNFSGVRDPIPYVASGVAIGAYRPDAVGPAIRSALSDPETIARMSEQRPAFLRRHLLVDGASSADRIVDLALGLARDMPQNAPIPAVCAAEEA